MKPAVSVRDDPAGGIEDQRRDALFASTIVRNSVFMISSQVAMKIIGFLFNVFIVRKLGAEHFGKYATVMAFIAIFAIFTDLGMAPYLLREVARDRTSVHWLLPNVVILRLFLTFPVLIIATLIAQGLGKEQDIVLGIVIGASGLFIYAVQGPLDAVLMAWERLDLSALFNVVYQLLFWGFGLIFLFRGWGFHGLLISSLVGIVVVAICAARVVLKEIPVSRMQIKVGQWRNLITAALPFGVSSISLSVQGRFDSVLMSVLLSEWAVGLYNVPLQLIQTLLLLAQSITISMFPSMTKAFSQGLKSAHQLVHRAVKFLLMFSLPIAVGTFILADRIIILLYTEEYRGSIPLLRVLGWSLPLVFLAELMGAVAMALQKEREGARVNVINALISMLMGAAAMPIFGALGAAFGRLLSKGVLIGQYWRLLTRELLVGDTWKDLIRVVLASTVMGVSLLFLQHLYVVLAILFGAGVYMISLFLFQAITWEEVRYFTHLFRKRRPIEVYSHRESSEIVS